MDKKKAMEYISKFPEISQEISKEMHELLPTFILYRGTISDGLQARCSTCGAEFDLREWWPEFTQRPHKVDFTCPFCGLGGKIIDASKNYNGMHKEGVANSVVFLSGDDGNLYVRCFTQTMFFEHGKIEPKIETEETCRYVFTEKSSARFSKNKILRKTEEGKWVTEFTDWNVRCEVTNPVFHNYSPLSYINLDAINNTCMKYSCCSMMDFEDGWNTRYMGAIGFLKFYQKHRGAERLIKCGFRDEVVNAALKIKDGIDWSQTEPHKMLGISKNAFRLIRSDKKISLTDYREVAKRFPNMPEGRQIECLQVIKNSWILYDRLSENVPGIKLVKYLIKQKSDISIYWDYFQICKRLQYDLNDEQIVFPPHLSAAHDRVLQAETALKMEREAARIAHLNEDLEKLKEMRNSLEFEFGDFIVVQPDSVKEIIEEGKILHHCVGGYAERHAKGKLSIMFLRKKAEPKVPFYTIEVSDDLKIVQCRGFRNNFANNPKPPEIYEVEQNYQNYLNEIFAKRKLSKKHKTKMKKGA